MPKTLAAAFIVAITRNGRMTTAQHFLRSEVGRALAFIEAVRASGADVTVTVVKRDDGEGITPAEAKRLDRAARS